MTTIRWAGLGFVLAIGASTVLAKQGCPAVDVQVQDGRIVLRCRSGVRIQITKAGRASRPMLAARGDLVYFLWNSDGGYTGLWSARRDAAWVPQGLLLPPFQLRGRLHQNVLAYEPAVADATLFVLLDYSATSFLLAAVDTASQKVVEILPASAFAQVKQGRHKGQLVVVQRSPLALAEGTGRIIAYVYSLIDPHGRTLRRFGEDRAEVEGYLGFSLTFWP